VKPGSTLFSRALVVPHDARTQHVAVRVHQDKPVHLSGEPDACNVARGNFLEYAVNHIHARAPPVRRILFRPQWTRRKKFIFIARGGDHIALCVNDQCFGRSGADINAE
jgi:hypothetical protein